MIQEPQIADDSNSIREKTVFRAFEYAYVINLDEDRERLEKISSRLDRLGVPFDRFPAVGVSGNTQFSGRHVLPEAYACAETHAALLRLILQREHESVLILEDDAVFRDDTADLMEKIASDLTYQPWDIFYMGINLIHSGARITEHLGRVRYGFHAHAYAVNKHAVPRLLTCIEQMLANPVQPFHGFQDDTLVKLYAIPILAIQEPNYSRTVGRYFDRLPQYFSVFDGDEFEDHCAEMKTWHNHWREIVRFGAAFNHANKLYKGGSLEQAAGAYVLALAELPELETELSTHPDLSWIVRVLKEPDRAKDEQLLNGCTSLVEFVYRAWPIVKSLSRR